jgi:hypothetical protein
LVIHLLHLVAGLPGDSFADLLLGCLHALDAAGCIRFIGGAEAGAIAMSKTFIFAQAHVMSVNSLENNTEEAKEESCWEGLEEILATLPCSDAEREHVRQQYRMLAALGKKPYFLAST